MTPKPAKTKRAKGLSDKVDHIQNCLETLCFWLVQANVFGEHDYQYFRRIVYKRVKAVRKKWK